MRLRKLLGRYGLVAIALPGLLLLTGISTLADASPSPSGQPLPGDPAKGATAYAQSCASCHGTSLEGNIGPALSPIEKLPGVANPLDVAFLIDIITNGRKHQPGDPKQTDMPAKGGNSSLTDQDVKDLAAFIIQSNESPGNVPLSQSELAKRTIFWVGVGIIAMVFVTFLLAQYNMRWIARRAAARRNR